MTKQPTLFGQGSDAYGSPLTPRETGHAKAEACAEKAEQGGWDREAAASFVLAYLREHGDSHGEAIVRAAMERHPAHKAKAYGAVLGALARQGLIRRVGYAPRANGHGSPGIVWGLA